MMQRWAMCVAYLGTAYYGWQRQSKHNTVQQVLEQAITAVANHPITTICAGRTDSGVHALMQVIHFESDAVRTVRQWQLGVNSHLPPDVVICWVVAVPSTFHARFSATKRQYCYVIDNAQHARIDTLGRALWVPQPLDSQLMDQAAQAWLGRHDFSALRASGCQADTPVRKIFNLSVQRQGDWVVFEMTANAFLYRMVRNSVGVLLAVGQGRCSPEWTTELLKARTRAHLGVTAAAHGLYLKRIEYDDVFELPKQGQVCSWLLNLGMLS